MGHARRTCVHSPHTQCSAQATWLDAHALHCHTSGHKPRRLQRSRIRQIRLTADKPTADEHNTLQADTIADPIGAVGLIATKCPARKLMAVYRVPSFEGPEGLLRLVATSRGRLLPGGVPDMEVESYRRSCMAGVELVWPVLLSRPGVCMGGRGKQHSALR